MTEESAISENSESTSDSVECEAENEITDDFVDILGNGSVTKKVLSQGLGRDSHPNNGDSVVISYSGWLNDGTLVDEVKSANIVIGDCECIPAIHLALPLAQLKEEFELKTTAQFAFGALGRQPEIPQEADLTYRVVLEECGDPPNHEKMSKLQRYQIADRKRELGNYYFSRENYHFSLTAYSKAAEILTLTSDVAPSPLDSDDAFPARTPEDFLELEVKLCNNIAATQLKLGAFQAAAKTCDSVLRLSPDNTKALFRKAKALVGSGDFPEAIALFQRVLELMPTSSQAKIELVRARSSWRKMRDSQKRSLGKVFRRPDSGENLPKCSRLKNLCYQYRIAISALLIAGISVSVGAAAMRYSG